MSQVFPFASDYGTLVVFDPEVLQHRVRETEGWWRGDLLGLDELAAGKVAILPIGKEGNYRVALRDGLTESEQALAVGTSPALGLHVVGEEVFVGAAERLPGDGRGERLSHIPDTGGLVPLENGDYTVVIHVLNWRNEDAYYDEDGEVVADAPPDFVVVVSPREGEFSAPDALPPLLELLPKHEAKAKAKILRNTAKPRSQPVRPRRRRSGGSSAPSSSPAAPTVARPPEHVPEEVAPYSPSRVRAAFREVLYGDLLHPPETGPAVEMILFKPREKGLMAHDLRTADILKKTLRVREQLRVLEAKVNGHKGMSYSEKAELETPITRVYESLDELHGYLSGWIDDTPPPDGP